MYALVCGIIGLCESAATAEIVKRFWSRVMMPESIARTSTRSFSFKHIEFSLHT